MDVTIPAQHKPGLAAADPKNHTTTSNVLVWQGGEQAYVAATNTRILAVLPVGGTGPDLPQLLPAKAVCANGKPATVTIEGPDPNMYMEVRKVSGKKTEVFPLPEQTGLYPHIKGVMPDIKGPMTMLTLDANQLKLLADAIAGDGVVTLFLPPPPDDKRAYNKAIAVVGVGADTREMGIGVVMPIHTPDEKLLDRAAYYWKHCENLPAAESLWFTQRFSKDSQQ